MKTTKVILVAAWLFTLVAAFTVGKKINSSDNGQEANSAHSSEKSRYAHRASTRHRDSSSARRSGNLHDKSRSDSTSGEKSEISTIMTNDDPVARAKALIDFINRTGANDFEQAITDFRALGITRERMSEYAMLLHAWGKTDPLAALDYAEKNTGTPFARQTILASWAADNPDGAMSWAQDHHEGEGANPWLVGIIRGVVTTNPTRATEILSTLPYSRERGDALAAIIPHIARLGQDKANEWLSNITDERLHAGGATYLAEAMAKNDPAATAEWVTNLDSPTTIARAAGRVADIWADSDLDAAIAWTEALPEQAKTNAAQAIISHYIKEDPTKASSWMSSMANQEGYERVVTSFIWNTARSHPELSLNHIPEIKNERSRERYYERILSNWQEKDAEAAQTWMQNNEVPESVKQRMLRRQERSRRGR